MSINSKRIKIGVGSRFGKLLVIENLGNSKWRCECLCGEIEVIRTRDLPTTLKKMGNQRSRTECKLCRNGNCKVCGSPNRHPYYTVTCSESCWKIRNKEQVRQANKRLNQRNPGYHLRKQKEYYKRDRIKILSRQKSNRLRDIEEARLKERIQYRNRMGAMSESEKAIYRHKRRVVAMNWQKSKRGRISLRKRQIKLAEEYRDFINSLTHEEYRAYRKKINEQDRIYARERKRKQELSFLLNIGRKIL